MKTWKACASNLQMIQAGGDERLKVQDDLDSGECWVDSNQTKFSSNKSNVLNAVSKNQLHKSRVRETWPDYNSHKKRSGGFSLPQVQHELAE
jgi:hypothetical protein